MSLRVSVNKLLSSRIICKHNQQYTINIIHTKCINTKTIKYHFSTQQKDDGTPPKKPRKLATPPSHTTVTSALSGQLPSGYTTQEIQSETIHKSTSIDPEPTIDPISSEKQTDTEQQQKPEIETPETTETEQEQKQEIETPETAETDPPKTEHSKPTPSIKHTQSSKKSKLTPQQYAYNILNDEILETPKKQHEKYDINALSEDEQRLYKVVQHLINEGFIDEMELLNLGKRREEIESDTSCTFNKFEKDNESKTNGIELNEDGMNKWREETIKEMDDDIINYKNIRSEALIVNTKQFMMNRNYGDSFLNELESDNYYELSLDDRDLKHILIYLIYNHLNTKRFHELNPSIKELAFLLYGIKTQRDFNRLLNTMSRTRKQIENIMQSYPRQSTPNILINYDKTNELQYIPSQNNDGIDDKYKYDEYGQIIDQTQREMTSFELDTTIKRIQDLEFRQYGYLQPQSEAKYDASDDDLFVNIIQNEQEAEQEETAKNEETKQEISDQDVSVTEDNKDKQETDKVTQTKGGYYNSVMEKVQQRWNGDLMDINLVGGDWRVRLGIAERQVLEELDVEEEVEKQYKRQLNESIAYTARRRYKMSPWKIPSLPFKEAKELEIDFRNIKLLNKFVNDRGMILPRRFTGVDKQTQKKIAKAIKRARKMGFMPSMSKLIIFDEEKIINMQQQLGIKEFLQNEKDEYDMMNTNDLQNMYPEYAANDDEENKENIQFKQKEYNKGNNNDDLEIDFSAEYDIDKEEIIYQQQVRKQQNMFMKQIKKDIIKKIPEYWQKRLSFRDKSNQLVNRLNNEKKRKQVLTQRRETKFLEGVKTKVDAL